MSSPRWPSALLFAAIALSPLAARAEAPELHVTVHGGVHAVVEDELNPKGLLPVFGVGLAALAGVGPVLVGVGGDVATLAVESDAMLYAAVGWRRAVASRRAFVVVGQLGLHRVVDCVDAVLGSGCNPGARLPFAGARIGLERGYQTYRPFGLWLSVAQDLRTEHVPEATRAPTYGGTVVLLSVSTRFGGPGL